MRFCASCGHTFAEHGGTPLKIGPCVRCECGVWEEPSEPEVTPSARVVLAQMEAYHRSREEGGRPMPVNEGLAEGR